MSIIAKQIFTSELKNRLSDKLTSSDTEKVITELINQLAGYDIEQNVLESNQKEFREMIEIYLNTLLTEGKSENTIYQYRRKLIRLMEYDPTPIRLLTVFNIRQYLAHEQSRGLKSTSIQGTRDVYHAFFGWLHREGLLPTNPCANLSPIKTTMEEKKPFTDLELERLRSACTTKRDKAVFYFLLTTGCRISEIVNLNRTDIDFINLEAKVLGKGKKERTVYFTRVAAMYLEQYLKSRKDDHEALFVGVKSSRYSKNCHEKRLKEIGKKAKVTNVHPHRFRRTLATNLIKNGMPILEVAMLLGHSKIDTTRKYVSIEQEKVKSSYQHYA